MEDKGVDAPVGNGLGGLGIQRDYLRWAARREGTRPRAMHEEMALRHFRDSRGEEDDAVIFEFTSR